MHIGETTTRLGRVTSRRASGEKRVLTRSLYARREEAL